MQLSNVGKFFERDSTEMSKFNHFLILPSSTTAVRCTVSLCGRLCQPIKIANERNNNNYHRLDRRENEFYDAVRGVGRYSGEERRSIIRWLLWVMDEQQAESRQTVVPCFHIGHPTVISRTVSKFNEKSGFSCN